MCGHRDSFGGGVEPAPRRANTPAIVLAVVLALVLTAMIACKIAQARKASATAPAAVEAVK